MQGLNNLTKAELLELVRTLEHRLEEHSGHALPLSRPGPLELDFVCGQALQVLDNSGIPAFIYDTHVAADSRAGGTAAGDFTVLAANHCMAALTGYSTEELLQQGLMRLLAHDEREGVRRLLNLPRQGGFSSSGGWRHRTKTGEIREVEASGYDLDFRGRRARFVIVQDVTRRRRDALMQQRLASIVESSHDAILSMTVDGTVLSWNQAAERLFGYAAAEIVGRSLDPLLPPEIAEQEKAWIRPRILAGEHVDSRETVRVHKNGERIEVSSSVAPLRDASGAIVGMSSIMRDIRPHKEAERKLAESHERLRALASLSYDWCWEQDEELRFTYHSGEWAENRDPVLATVIGRTRFDLPIIWPSEQHREEHARALAEHKPFKDVEYHVRCEGRREYHVTITGEPVFDAAARFKGYRGIGRDVTERRKQERELQLLSAVVASTGDAIMSWALHGSVLSWNPSAEAMLGFPAEEILGKSVALLMAPGNSDWEEITQRVAAGEQVLNHETVRRHRNGTMIQVTVTCSPLRDEAGRVTAVSCVTRDILRQKLQERLVVEGHQRLKLALDSADLSLWDWDIPASRVHYDDAFARQLGFAAGELMPGARLWHGLIHPDDAALVAERIDSHLAGQSEFCDVEFRARRRDGEWLWVGARGRVVTRDRTGQPLRMTGTCQDISARKRAEQTSQMLASFLDSSEDSIMSCTLDGTILSWNRGAERILGRSAAEMIGTSHWTIVPEERREENERITDIVRAGRTISSLETVRSHKDGHDVHMALTFAPLRDTDGKVIGVASIGRDITQRIHADSTRSLLAAVVESSQDAIISHNLDGTILSWNRGAEEIFGYSSADVAGRDYRLLVPGESPEHVRERCLRLARGERIQPFEAVGRRKDGSTVLISVSVAALRGDNGRIVGVAAVARDVGAQKRLELLMARTQAIGHVGGWEVECRSGRLFWTDETYRIHDLSPGKYVPTVDSAIGFFAPEAVAAMDRAMRRAMDPGEPFDLELPLTTARGRRIWVRAIGETQREDGRVSHVYGTLQDITGRRQAEDALRESERQLDSILDNAAEGMIVLSANGGIERLNRQAQHMFGYDAHEGRALHLKQITVELGYDEQSSNDTQAAPWMQHLLGSHREVTGRRKDGSIFPLELAVSEIAMSPGPNKFTAIVRDITDRKSWENRIYSLAYSDSLTGLPNRLLLRDRLEHAIAQAQRNRTLVGILFFDLDHFKAINDSYGHHVGDELLREIGDRTRSCVREIDTVSRLGGDEFVVVLPELREPLDAAAVARKILSALGQSYRIDGHDLTITQTLGISIYPQDGPDADTLLRNADSAMYHAKESGKARFQFFGAEARDEGLGARDEGRGTRDEGAPSGTQRGPRI
jgi:diguanylate cyclase (GGDEF)-like protein/PAS domain S-box-containing protein